MLLQVGRHGIYVQARELTRCNLALKHGCKRDTAFNRHIARVHLGESPQDTVATDKIGSSGPARIVRTDVAQESVDREGSSEAVLQAVNVEEILVVTSARWAALIWKGSVDITLAAAGARAIEGVHGSTDGGGGGAALGFWVYITENGGGFDIHCSEEVASGVLVEGLQGYYALATRRYPSKDSIHTRIGILNLSCIPLEGILGQLSTANICARLKNLPHSHLSVDVAVEELAYIAFMFEAVTDV